MTKKLKTCLIIVASIVVIVATALTVFFVCFNKKEEYYQLETPTLTFLPYENEKILVCTFDPNATDYAFYIYCDGDYPNRKYDYIEYRASEQTPQGSSVQSYLDVTDIFVEPKDYYFFCKVIGGGKYLNSNETEIQSYSNKYKLSTPQTLSFNGTTLSWRGVNNVDHYEVYEVGQYAMVGSTVDTSLDVTRYIESKSQASFSFYVIAVGSGNYISSEQSNVAHYEKSFILGKASGLNFNKTNNLLSWNKVDNALSYEIVVNGTEVLSSNTFSINLSQYVQSTGDYTFKVRAIGHDEYQSGEFSDVLRVQKTQRLNGVSNLKCEVLQDEDLILITWDFPDEAQTFTITINGEVHSTSFASNNILLKKGDLSQIKIEIIVNGYNYYTSSNAVSKTFNL